MERCAAVMAYAMASDAYGKAGEKGYNLEKDTASLIAQIVHGDPYGDDRRWTTPFWAKSHATIAPTPAPESETPRPAHRPTGDRDKHLVTFRRVLEAIVPDEFGRLVYILDDLADKMKAARTPTKPRTIQSYLKTLRDNGEIVTAHIDGNGSPYAILTRWFGDADNSEKRVKIAPEPPLFGRAYQIAEERILTPQSVETSPQCNGDHQNPSALPSPPHAAQSDDVVSEPNDIEVLVARPGNTPGAVCRPSAAGA